MGKTLNLDEVKHLFKPKPGEVYFVPDPEVRMTRTEEQIDADKSRTVLIVASNELLKSGESPSYNIIPLTTSGEPDLLSFLIGGKYKDVAADFKPDKNSLALLHFYQPIRKEILNSRCGRIDDDCYRAIVYALCVNVIGYEDTDYDLEP